MRKNECYDRAMRKNPRERQVATERVLDAGRTLGAAAVMFHSVVAERQGLGPTEEKTLDLLLRQGPLTAGDIAVKSGLAPPSVTGLVNRLERKGFVRRIPDRDDGRKVRVEAVRARVNQFVPLFANFVRGMNALCLRYSVAELDLVARFFTEAAEIQLDAARALVGENPET